MFVSPDLSLLVFYEAGSIAAMIRVLMNCRLAE